MKDVSNIDISKRRNFKLHRTRQKLLLTAAGLAALISLGVMVAPVKESSHEVVSVSLENSLYSIDTANDLVLNRWASYAVDGVLEEAKRSEYEQIRDAAELMKTDFYYDLETKYYKYLDIADSTLPCDIVKDSLNNCHREFRSKAKNFDEALKNSFFSKGLTFGFSPYANAIVVNENGKKLEANDMGETYFGDSLVTQDDNYTVLVRAIDIPNNQFDLSNLPKDAILIDGVIYVSDQHIHDFNFDYGAKAY